MEYKTISFETLPSSLTVELSYFITFNFSFMNGIETGKKGATLYHHSFISAN